MKWGYEVCCLRGWGGGGASLGTQLFFLLFSCGLSCCVGFCGVVRGITRRGHVCGDWRASFTAPSSGSLRSPRGGGGFSCYLLMPPSRAPNIAWGGTYLVNVWRFIFCPSSIRLTQTNTDTSTSTTRWSQTQTDEWQHLCSVKAIHGSERTSTPLNVPAVF